MKRKAAEDKADQLQKKLNFNEGLNKEQMKKADGTFYMYICLRPKETLQFIVQNILYYFRYK